MEAIPEALSRSKSRKRKRGGNSDGAIMGHRSYDRPCFVRSLMMMANGLSVGASTSFKVFVS
jgi:hypothetical protein